MSTTPRGAPFGAHETAHQLRMLYRDGAWGEPAIEPSGPLILSPRARALHYGQSVFEGIKAQRQARGGLALFRVRDHLARLVRSCERMCIPAPPVERLLEATLELITLDGDATPQAPGALYVRPFVFADQADLLPAPAESYTLMVLLAPVEPYFAEDGLRLVTETTQVRAAPGGTGTVKCAGNYGAVLAATRAARRDGFDEVVWLDPLERRWLEETGAMNLMLVHEGALVTPPLSGTLLAGITRDSLLTLARDEGLVVREEPVPIDDPSFWSGVSEVFSSGTAVGTGHVRELVHLGEVLFHGDGAGPVGRRLGQRLSALKEGRVPDPFGWLEPCLATPFPVPSWIRC